MKSLKFNQKLVKLLFFTITLLFVYSSSLNAQGWVVKPLSINSTKNAIFFLNPTTGFMVGSFPFILKSTNGGDNWTSVNASSNAPLLDVFFVNDNVGYAVGGSDQSDGVILKTVNGGDNWTSQVSGTDRILTCVHFFDANNGIIGSEYFSTLDDTSAFLVTSNGGANWNKVPASQNTKIYSMSFPTSSVGFAVGGISTAGTNPNIYQTNNGGGMWTFNNSGMPEIFQSVFFTDVNTGYAVGKGQFSAIIKTTNSGVNWTSISSAFQTDSYYGVYFTSNSTGYVVGTSSGGARVLKTSNGGTNWISQFSQNGTVSPRSVFFINESTGWVCGSGSNILKTTDGGGTVGISTISSEVPSDYTLKQNYPNPFNPSTNIDFNITKKGFVSLKVFNSQGKEVANLVNNNLTAGSYSFTFNPGSLSSGVYFYRLAAEGFTETKKMLFIK